MGPAKRMNCAQKQLQRARDYIVEVSGGLLGGGDDPFDFLIASHADMRAKLKDAECRKNHYWPQACKAKESRMRLSSDGDWYCETCGASNNPGARQACNYK